MATGEKFFFGVKGENTYKINIGRDGVLSASNSTTASGGAGAGGGSGGVAGKGGKIKVSSNATIYAFNGDRITNNDYTATNVNYDASGKLSNGKTDGTGDFIEAKIYAQAGLLRDVYCITAKWGEKPNHNYAYFRSIFGDTCSITGDFTNPTAHDENYKNVNVRQARNITPLSYINSITNNCQGIGSGAGYMEVSNGTYTVDASMN